MFSITAETRRALPEDAGEISRVHLESWQNAYAGMVPHAALARMINRRGEDWWEMAIRRATIILVIEVGNEIAGYATLGPNRVSTLPFEGEIYEIYLKPEYQGIGLGTKLFADAKRELRRRSFKGLVVWALADNDSALSFYRNAGGRAVASGSEHFDHKKLDKTAFAWN
ncbi:MAG: GNAT family N-acetyltransferase [Rhizobiaceae bacterium]